MADSDGDMNITRRHSLYALTILTGVGLFSASQAQSAGEKAVVTGRFLGDRKDGKIQHLVVQARDPFNDKTAIRLIFTEKNTASSEKPEFDAAFKKLGSALILSVDREGGIFGCEVAHTAHPKSPFSALGRIKMEEFQITDTQVSGHVVTGGELDAFGQKWEVDLTFSAPLPKGAFTAVAGAKPETENRAKMVNKDADEPIVAGPKFPISELPLPTAATNVEYKKIVEQIVFSSDTTVSAFATEFSSKLIQKGWKESPGSLKTKASAILRFKRNTAELTIMVKPAGSGCTANVMTKGLDWTNTPPSTPAQKSPTCTNQSTGGLEAEANHLINDALKLVPGGLK